MRHLQKISSPYVLAENLDRLMQQSDDLRTQANVAKRAGIAQTAVSLMLRPDARARTKSGKTPSPKLAEVERVAGAFGMHLWQLLIDPNTLTDTVARALTSPAKGDEAGHKRPSHKVKA